MILPAAVTFAIGCFALAMLLNLWRLLTASNLPDRILAVDTMLVNGIALIVLYGVKSSSGVNFEVAIILALTGFVSSVAFCKFLLRGQVIE